MKISSDSARQALTWLESIGLVEYQSNRWTVSVENLHVPESSMFLNTYRSQWRQFTSTQFRSPRDIKYTATFAASSKDLEKIKDTLVNALAQIKKTVIDSNEEELACVMIELFHFQSDEE